MLLLTALAGVLSALPADADMAGDELVVEAGLATAVTINCFRPLSMGRIAVPAGPRGGPAFLTLSTLPDAQPINLDSFEPAHSSITLLGDSSNGGCTVTGGTPETCVLPVAPDLDENNYRVTLTPGPVLGLPASTTSGTPFASFTIYKTPTFTTPLEFDKNGEVAFGIGAAITIRDNLSPADFGGFAATLTIMLDDVECP